ncbi:MAG: hypothetical protein KF895_03080 [Parvibaculum sp.]|nr:hypothetical protein [Parvibaculum sp.]
MNQHTSTEAMKTRAAIWHGYLLAEQDGKDRPALTDAIWYLLTEAARTMDSLPDKERGWLRTGSRASWPANTHTPIQEWTAIWNERMQSGIAPYDAPKITKAGADPAAIDRMLTVMGWLKYINGKGNRRARMLQRFIIIAAEGRPPHVLRRVIGVKTAQGVRDIKRKALRDIASALKSRWGVE